MKRHPNKKILVAEDGRIYSLRERLLKARLTEKGYLRGDYGRVHRLVAETYIENPLNLPEVNHIDGNKLNNHVSNLEWVSHRDNMLHAYRVLKVKPSNLGKTRGQHNNAQPISAIDSLGNQVHFFECLNDVRSNGFDLSSVWRSNKTGQSYKGLFFKYLPKKNHGARLNRKNQ